MAHDPLTGLPDRAALTERMTAALDDERSGALLLIEVEGLRLVNATYGIPVGDLLLQEIGRRLVAACGRDALVAGGMAGTFAALIAEAPEPVASASQIRSALSSHCEIDGQRLFIAAHIAVVPLSDVTSTVEVGRRAAAAMEHAKHVSVDQTAIYDEVFAARLRERVEITTDLRAALDGPEAWGLQLHYQPIMSAESGGIVSFEALMRWQHPQRGLLSPAVVVPAAEADGLVLPFGSWALRTAARQAAAWQERGVSVSVNIAAPQLVATGFLDELRAVLEEFALRPGALSIEVLERLLIEAPERAIATLHEVRELGCRVYLDDFGTGYSSLSYLRELPTDVVKLDRSFIAPILDSSRDRTVVEQVIGLAHALDLEVVAEGVETAAHRDALLEMGCDRFQGWLFAKAMPATEAEHLLDGAAVL